MKSSHPDFAQSHEATWNEALGLVAKLSLEEKIDLLSGHPSQGSSRGVEHAGIIEYKMSDGPVGVHWWCKASTCYPTSVGLAASFNPELVRRVGAAIGRDARARGIHILLAPGVNLYRLPVCGRNFEYFGEDPHLSAEMAVEYIEGVQSQRVAATVKHFALNYQEFDRHWLSSDPDERSLFEFYLRPFEAAVKRAGTGAVMTAYNLIDGVHCSESRYLITDILKKQWGFLGLVMSDWVSVYSDVAAANAGLDLEMPTARWFDREHLMPAVEDGRIPLEVIDDKVLRLVYLGLRFGWYKSEQKDSSIPERDPETERVALEAAREVPVLLKNEDALLPLALGKKVLLIGSHAEPAVIGGGGSAYNEPFSATGILAGVKALVGDQAEIIHRVGVDPERALGLFGKSDFVAPDGQKGLLGEYFNNPNFEGAPFVTRVDEHPDFSWRWEAPAEGMEKKGVSMRWRGFVELPRAGKYRFYVQCNHGNYTLKVGGKELLKFEDLNLRRFPDLAEIVVDKAEKLTVDLEYQRPRDDDGIQLAWEPASEVEVEARLGLEAARGVDAVVACFGFTRHTESECDDREYALPQVVSDYIRELSRINPNLVLVLFAGGSVDAAPWVDSVKALLHVFYPGQEGGKAIAEILFGQESPSGKLPFSWERRLEDRGEFDNYFDDAKSGHVALKSGIFGGYRHFDREGIEPLFPFGYGQSYTRFEYSELKISPSAVEKGGKLSVEFMVKNVGQRPGRESVQVYLSALRSRVPRPNKELVGFAKCQLEPGESKVVTIELAAEMCRFYDVAQHDFTTEPGEFELQVGPSSRDLPLRARLQLV